MNIQERLQSLSACDGIPPEEYYNYQDKVISALEPYITRYQEGCISVLELQTVLTAVLTAPEENL